jgi:hypothetical protein
VKVITFSYDNSKVINFTALRSLTLEEDTPLDVYKPKISSENMVA